MANYYSEVLDFLFFDKEINYADLVVQIAKKHPKIVMDAVNLQRDISHNDSWQKKAREILASDNPGSKISAIKLCRNETGAGLKEAKELVESL